ncbi:MAG: histidine phosphatase family protein [Chitinophagaceae bacterium]|nr:histidine phosphatase family protein [Chitinophagaceae bacterium]
MNFIICTALFLSTFFFTSCQSTNEIYIVRHAEKSAEPASDPHLTTDGKFRAEILKDILKDKKIKAIFSTEKNRTMETAAPLSRLLNIAVQYYRNDTLPGFLKTVAKLKKNSLIVGHSNTTVTMISSLRLPQTITYIPEDDYDNFFIIKVKNGRVLKLTETTYGTVSPKVK